MQILALYAGLLGLVFIFLSYRVVAYRRSLRIGIGSGDNKDLNRAIRVHANFVEYVPIALVLLAVFELNQGNFIVSHICGALLLVGRLLHAYGLGKTVRVTFGRFIGTLLTWIVISFLSIANIYYFMVLALGN